MFKKFILILCIVVIAGCGLRSDKKPKRKGSSRKKNYIAIGVKLLEQKKVPEAIKSFHKAIAAEPQNLGNYFFLSQVHYKLGNYEGAVDALTAGLKVAPDNPEAYYHIAISLDKQGDKVMEASKAAQKSLEIFSGDRNEPGVKRAVFLLIDMANRHPEIIPTSNSGPGGAPVMETPVGSEPPDELDQLDFNF